MRFIRIAFFVSHSLIHSCKFKYRNKWIPKYSSLSIFQFIYLFFHWIFTPFIFSLYIQFAFYMLLIMHFILFDFVHFVRIFVILYIHTTKCICYSTYQYYLLYFTFYLYTYIYLYFIYILYIYGAHFSVICFKCSA